MLMEHERCERFEFEGFSFFSDDCVGPNVTSFYKIVFYNLISHLFVFEVSTYDTYVKNNCVKITPEHTVI